MAVETIDPAVETALAPLREQASRSALFFDIDGTLAPVVERSHEARVPDEASKLLGSLARSYAVVACVSGRPASEARRLVGVGSVTYAGSHGAELLRGGAEAPEVLPELASWRERVRAFATEHDTFDLRRTQVRIEDKDFIQAFHWRGVADEETAQQTVETIAAEAEREGLVTHWGRKVLEVRPPVTFDKGFAVRRIVQNADAECAFYAGDDNTDADAFAALRELQDDGKLQRAVCLAVLSDETPDAVRAGADLTVRGTEQMLGVLRTLAV